MAAGHQAEKREDKEAQVPQEHIKSVAEHTN